MNSCGQHMVANIGFHGSSIKKDGLVIPALQVVIGGGVDKEGKGFIADKVIKLPSKRIPVAVKALLTDYEINSNEGEYYNDYYQRQGKMYFYNLLKEFANLETLSTEDYVDWGHSEQFVPEIGVGECAGVSLDVVGTIINDAETKLNQAQIALIQDNTAAGIYDAYNTFVIGAKALLLSEDQHCNTQIGIINDFETAFVESNKLLFDGSFSETVLSINKYEPTPTFGQEYVEKASAFLESVKTYRLLQLNGEEKLVVNNYYKA